MTEPSQTPTPLTPALKTNPLATFAIIAVINAAVQSLLILPQPIFGLDNTLFLTLSLASTVVLLISAVLVLGTVLVIGEQPPTLGNSLRRIRPRIWALIGWLVIWIVLVVAGLLAWIVPGLLITAAFPFVAIAIADGNDRPFRTNFRAIRTRFGGFVATLLGTFLALVGIYLASALMTFLLPAAVAAFVTWIVLGLVGAWLVRVWVRAYRHAMARLDQPQQTPRG